MKMEKATKTGSGNNKNTHCKAGNILHLSKHTSTKTYAKASNNCYNSYTTTILSNNTSNGSTSKNKRGEYNKKIKTVDLTVVLCDYRELRCFPMGMCV